MPIILDFLGQSYSVLIILFVLVTFMVINRDSPPPASKTFRNAFLLILLLAVLNYFDVMLEGNTGYQLPDTMREMAIPLRQVVVSVQFLLQPFVILMQIRIIAPSRRYKIFTTVLALLNAAVYLPAAFGARFAFFISENNTYTRGPLGYTIYFVLISYTVLLYLFSIMYFDQNKLDQSILLLSIVIIAFGTGFGEVTNVIMGYTTEVIAVCTLAYYLYLTAVHQQEYRAEIAEKKAIVAQQEMTILREQIQPHFIYNSLNIIRSLIRKDSRAAIGAIDNFSDYLQAHFRTLRHDTMIDFEQELEHVKAYLSLAEADYTRKTQIIFHLGVTQFKVPPLCLEPIVENAILHGTNESDGIITIASHAEETCYVIEVSDNGTGDSNLAQSAQKRVGIGVENTKKRLALLCGGSLEMQKAEQGGTVVRIIIPRTEKEESA